jgi:hypothetical protein
MKKSHKAIMHFNKHTSKIGKPWTIHYRGTCHIASKIICNVPMVSEWKPNRKNNPRAFFTAQIYELNIDKHGNATLN